MLEIHYGVVQRNGCWIITGDRLRLGSYARRSSAISAARRLAAQAGGLPVHLDIQDETGAPLMAMQAGSGS
jgi:hypothetical protein